MHAHTQQNKKRCNEMYINVKKPLFSSLNSMQITAVVFFRIYPLSSSYPLGFLSQSITTRNTGFSDGNASAAYKECCKYAL